MSLPGFSFLFSLSSCDDDLLTVNDVCLYTILHVRLLDVIYIHFVTFTLQRIIIVSDIILLLSYFCVVTF